MERDPVAFWRAQYTRARLDAEIARDRAPSVLAKLAETEREAWREWKAAVASAEAGASATAKASGPTTTATTGSLEEQLDTIRQMRREAQGDRSYVAAAKLLEQETQIVAAIGAREDAKAKATRSGMTSEERLAQLVARIGAMPPVVQERLRRALGW